jgi:hypothetical protein
MKSIELTEKESKVLKSIVESSMWGEATEFNGGFGICIGEVDFPFYGKELSGILGSLNKKCVVWSDNYDIMIYDDFIEYAESL